MFGLTFEKLLIVGLIAAVVIGPRRLPAVVAWVASLVRGLRRTMDAARLRAATDLGLPVDATPWHALDPRQYDPRRIIAEALAAPPVQIAAEAASGRRLVAADPAPSDPTVPEPNGSHAMAPNHPDPQDRSGAQPSEISTAPRTRRVRVGTSAHPRWIAVPADDTTTADEPGEASSPPAVRRAVEADQGPASVEAVARAVGPDAYGVERDGDGGVHRMDRQLAG